MHNDLCRTLDMKVPVFQAAIGGISCPALAAAVSNAGGLGSIALTGWGGDDTARLLREARKLTDRNIVANLLLSYDIADEFAAILESPPKVVSFFWGDISGYAELVHERGSLVMANVGSVEEAVSAIDAGADMLMAQGWEAGGHVRGQIATMALVPAIVDVAGPVPVIGAGGISDGRGLAAVMCLGAQGAWIGTSFLAATEADIHPVYVERVLAAQASDTFYSTLFDGGWPAAAPAPARALINDTVKAWDAAGRPARPARPGEGDVIVHDASGSDILRYDAVAMRSDMQGDIGSAPLWAGQGVGLVREQRPAAEIVSEIASEATAILERLG